MATYRVLLIDDQEFFRQACLRAPNAFSALYPGNSLVFEFANSGEAAREKLQESGDWDLLLVDLDLGNSDGNEGGMRLIAEILSNSSEDVHPKVAIFSATSTIAAVKKALDIGATGYITKDHSLEEFCTGIYEMLVNGEYASAGLKDMVVSGEPPAPKLTPTETNVVEMVLDGHSHSAIAKHLGVQQVTVTDHLREAYKKYGRNSLTGLLLYLMREKESG